MSCIPSSIDDAKTGLTALKAHITQAYGLADQAVLDIVARVEAALADAEAIVAGNIRHYASLAAAQTAAALPNTDDDHIAVGQMVTIYNRASGGDGGGVNIALVIDPASPPAGVVQHPDYDRIGMVVEQVTPMIYASPITDAGAAINAALASGRKVVIPDGKDLRVDTPIVLGGEQMHLHLGAKARLYAGPTLVGPVVRCTTNRFRLTGDGGVIEKAYPTGGLSSPTLEGVVNIGPEDETAYRNINFFDVHGLIIRGSLAKWDEYNAGTNNDIDADIGLKMVNGNMFGNSGSCYNGRIRELDIEAVGIGIDCERVVQGNNFHLLNFYKVTDAGIQMEGCGENTVNQTFYHFSGGVTMLRLRTTADDGAPFANRGSSGNSFTNFIGEPGPSGNFDSRFAKIIDIGVGCNENYVQGYGNTGHGWIDDGLRNTLINKAAVYTDANHDFRSRPVLREGVDFQLYNTGTFEMRDSRQIMRDWRKGFPAGSSPAHTPQTVFSVTSGAVNNFGLATFDLLSTSAATGNIGSAQFQLRWKTGSTNVMTAEIEQVGGATAFTASVSISGAVATVSITPSYYLHSNFIVMLRAKSFNAMTITEL